jgi:hypothetical protein
LEVKYNVFPSGDIKGDEIGSSVFICGPGFSAVVHSSFLR